MKKKIIISIMLFVLVFSAFTYAALSEYPEVYNLHWNNRTARWSVDGRADKYEIRLYRDDRRVLTKTVTGRCRNFSSEMARGSHEYYFEVRPYNYETGWGEWDESNTIYVNKTANENRRGNNVSPGGPIDSVGPGGYVVPTVPTVPNYPGLGPGEGTSVPTPQTIKNPLGQWVSANGFWHYQYTNGVYASNTWLLIGDKWYYLDANTNMAIGFMTIGQATYYFNPDGVMVTGTIILNGVTHYFDANGKMVY